MLRDVVRRGRRVRVGEWLHGRVLGEAITPAAANVEAHAPAAGIVERELHEQ